MAAQSAFIPSRAASLASGEMERVFLRRGVLEVGAEAFTSLFFQSAFNTGHILRIALASSPSSLSRTMAPTGEVLQA